MKIEIERKCDKYLEKLEKRNIDYFKRIVVFLKVELPNEENPFSFDFYSAKKIKESKKSNYWRWRIGNFRIKAHFINDEIKILSVFEITTRNDTTYSHTKNNKKN